MPNKTHPRTEAGLMVALAIASSLVIATAGLRWQPLAALFVSSDVALIYLASAVPLAFAGMRNIRRPAATLGALLLCGGGAALTAMRTEGASSTFAANVLRTSIALSIVASVTLIGRIFVCGKQIHRGIASCRPDPPLANRAMPGLGLGILMLVLLPTVYVQARCQQESTEFASLIEQSRLGEARTLMQTLRRLAPSAQIRGRSLDKVAAGLDREVQAIQLQLAAIPLGTKSPDQRLHRCRLLAMLGRSDEALAELIPLQDTSVSAAASDLCGTIHETNTNWSIARNFHHQAKSDWLRRPESPERAAGIYRATTRLAYCHRKLGAYDLAEAEYLEALAQSPTADTHFLLAQFYEDMQQSTKARDHARQAMKLAPQRYHHEGTQLIDKLIVGHFGCLTTRFTERSSSRQ